MNRGSSASTSLSGVAVPQPGRGSDVALLAEPRRRPHRAAGPLPLLLPALLVYLLTLAAPMALLVVNSLRTRNAGGAFSLANYVRLASDPYYVRVLGTTLGQAVTVTAICAVFGWPVAACLSQVPRRWRLFMTLIIIAPLLISVVVRSFGWVVLLGPGGMVDRALSAFGLHEGGLLYTGAAVSIGMVHVLLPIMIISISSAMNGIDPAVIRAAVNLGASPLGALLRVLVPLSIPGVAAGTAIVFSLTSTAFVTPMILGGATRHYMSTLIYQNAMVTLNFPMGGALAVMLLVTILIAVTLITAVFERILFPGVFRAQSR